ncbi:hypothetical protein BJX76DRAFT_366507 [Aspergillus varians]
MDPASLALSVLGTTELCLKCGKILINKYEDYKNAEQDVSEIVLKIKSLWLKTEIQLESIKTIWELIEPRLQRLFYELLDHLQGKLEVASASVDRVINRSIAGLSINKFKTMLFKKNIMHAAQDLESWQRIFDPSWFLITRVADSKIDSYLKDGTSKKPRPTEKLKQIRDAMSRDSKSNERSIFLDGESIACDRHWLPWSMAFTTHLSGGSGAVLVDTMAHLPGGDISLATTHVRDLARRLSNSDPWDFGLLHCCGVIKAVDEKGAHFQLIFDIPPTLSNPRTLRDILLRKESHALNQRFQLVKQLIRSLMFVHTSGFVHKSIRPETIVVFKEQLSFSILGPSFLIGFERFRPGGAGTFLSGDSSWEKNIYRHPKRQGLHPEERYIMQHDIYSLGVFLLEIGLWDSFVIPGSDGTSLKAGSALNIEEALVTKKPAVIIKRTLVSVAIDRLPGLMGQRYADLVLACLTCLDPGDTNQFGKEGDLQDDDGIVVGVQYIEKFYAVWAWLVQVLPATTGSTTVHYVNVKKLGPGRMMLTALLILNMWYDSGILFSTSANSSEEGPFSSP